MKIVSQCKRFLNQFLGLFPSRLPTGMTEFNLWVDSIIATYDLPTQNRDDILFVLTTSVIRTGEAGYKVPKFHFVKLIRSVCAKQVAGAVFSEVKQRQQDAQRKQAEATANTPPAVDNVQQLKQPV